MSINVELLTKKGALISDFNVNAQLNCSHNETLSKVGKMRDLECGTRCRVVHGSTVVLSLPYFSCTRRDLSC